MREIRFALGYMPHRLWGNILQAQFLEQDQGNEFYIPLEYIQNDKSTKAHGRLTPMQREVLKLIDNYSDRNLHRIFSKKRTLKEFQDTVDKKTIHDHIRPFIERYLYSTLEIARDNRISVFVNDKSNRNIFPEDFIQIEKSPADPVFSFHYDEVLSYSLNLIHDTHELILHKGDVEIVSYSPTAIILGNSLYFINEIDGKKLKPFLDKEKVIIPKEMVGKYFSTFVRNSLRDFNTLAEGFNVDKLKPSKKSELVLEQGMRHQPVWILTLKYNSQVIYPDSPLKRFVYYTGDGDHHGFEVYDRDYNWEERIAGVLIELGLRSRDQKNYHLNKKFNKGNGNDLYTAINFLNDAGPILAENKIGFRHRLQQGYYLGTIELDLESREQEDWFDVYAMVRFGQHSVPFLSLRKHILKGTREYVLPDGAVAVLPEEWFTRYRSMFEFGRSKGDRIMIHKQHFSLVEGPMREFHTDTLSRLEQLNKVELIPSSGLPSGLDAELRCYQEEGYKWLCFLKQNGFGGCLADDMGLGKTLQAIAVLLKSKQEDQLPGEADPGRGGQLSMFGTGPGKRTSLIVVPASLLHNWLNECHRFAPDLEPYAYVGNQRNRELSDFSCYDVIISTYHTVRQDNERLSTFRFH